LGRFSKPFVTGSNRIPFFNEENSDDDKQVVADPEEEERMGQGIALGRSWTVTAGLLSSPPLFNLLGT
jgi:hypothetical protein